MTEKNYLRSKLGGCDPYSVSTSSLGIPEVGIMAVVRPDMLIRIRLF